MTDKTFCDVCGKEIIKGLPARFTAEIRFNSLIQSVAGFVDSMDLCPEHAEAVYNFIKTLKEEAVKKA